MMEGQAEGQFEAAVEAQVGSGPKGNHAAVSYMGTLAAEKAGAVPEPTGAGRSGQTAPAPSARDAAQAAQDARDREAEGRGTVSRATALLHPGGGKAMARGRSRKQKPIRKARRQRVPLRHTRRR